MSSGVHERKRLANGGMSSAGKDHVSRDATLTQLMGIYLQVSGALVTSWVLGIYQFSFIWVFLIISVLFAIWRAVLSRIIQRRLVAEETLIHRKRALKQSETGEWLNFLLNRWWVFSANSIEGLVKKHINERLASVRPSFVSNLELLTFTFGEVTPALKYVQAFEVSEGVPGGRRPLAWNSVLKPPPGLEHMSNYSIVIEMEIDCHHDDFIMAFRSKVGSGRAGLNFDIAVEELGISGNLQVMLQMSMDVPFPHIAKATISFTNEPKLWFNIRVLKNLQIMEVPLLKTWLHTHITDGLSRALVDPGKIDIQIAKAGPVNVSNAAKGNTTRRLAEGVLTLKLKGQPVKDPKTDDERYTMLKLGNQKRQTPNVMASDPWEDVCSFFVYDLATEKLIVKNKCRRLLSNVTLDFHEVDLASFPLKLTSGSTTTVQNDDGSSVDITLLYSSLPAVCQDITNVKEQREITEVAGVVYVCVHSATNLIASDQGGTSDPYCVVFCDRRRVLTTPYVLKNTSPVWDSAVEFFVKDFTKTTLSFYVFDWDGINIINDDFLGSTHFVFKEGQSMAYRELLSLGYNNRLDGFQTDTTYGHITVSVEFRPVSNVAKSERYRMFSVDSGAPQDYLYREDLVSPAFVSTSPSHHNKQTMDDDNTSQGGGPSHSTGGRRLTKAEIDDMEGKIFVDLTLIQAKELQGMDRNGLSDPYCEVLVGSKKVFKSSIKNNTLEPKWNESTSFQVLDETHLLEINMYDKDILSKDFLGKVVLTLEQLKELSHRGTSDWIPLQRTKSGQIQIKCSVISSETVKQLHSANSRRGGSRKLKRQSSSTDVFLPSPDSVCQNNSPFDTIDHGNTKRHETTEGSENKKEQMLDDKTDDMSPIQSTASPMSFMTSPESVKSDTDSSFIRDENVNGSRSGMVNLQRSVSDVSESRRNEMSRMKLLPSNNNNSRHSDYMPNSSGYHSDNISLASTIAGIDRIYNVEGRVTQIRGLNEAVGKVYLKIRVQNFSQRRGSVGSRFNLLSRSAVVAKSSLMPANSLGLDLRFQIDRGRGVNVDTCLTFDVKTERKDRISQKTISLKDLFDDSPHGESQWVRMSHGVDLQLNLVQGQADPRVGGKKSPGVKKSLSLRKEKVK